MVVLTYSTNWHRQSLQVSQRQRKYVYTLNISNVTVNISIVYRPPPSKQNVFKNSLFFYEWSKYLDSLVIISYDVMIIGDLNVLVDNNCDVELIGFTVYWIHMD